MATIPCRHNLICPPGSGDLGIDFPYANLSSEEIDRQSWIGRTSDFVWWPPPLGSNWTKDSCLGLCVSYISQEDADNCAALNELICLYTDSPGVCPPPPCPPPPPPPPPSPPLTPPPAGPPPTLYTNSLQTCMATCADGSPFIYQVSPGTFGGWSQAMADQIALDYACKMVRERIICLGDWSVTWGCTDATFSSTLIATGPPDSPMGFTVVSGSLPPGTALVPYTINSVRLAGTPSTPGTYSFRIRVTDALLNYMEKNYSITIMGILNSSALSNGTDGTPYTAIFLSSGTTGGVSYSVVSGSLPTGLTLDASGLLSGTPTVNGNFSFTVRVTDSSTPARTCDKAFTLRIDFTPGSCPDWSTLTWPYTPGDPFIMVVPGVPPPVAAASTTPMAGASASGTFSLICNPHVGHWQAVSIANSGSVAYNGTGCNCNLRLTLLRTSGEIASPVYQDIDNGSSIYVNQGSVGIVAQYFFNAAPIQPAPTVVDIPFTLADTGGVPDLVWVAFSIGTQLVVAAANDSVYSGSFQVSNV